MSVAILGAAGQLGRDLCARYGPDAVPLTHRDADLTDRASLHRALSGARPQVVINTAAFNRVDDAEERPADAMAVNALGVRQLAIVCAELGCTLVHFSSDYVFGLDSARREPYDESCAPGPLGAYGLSKLAGEYFVRSICPHHLVIRTCGLYGLHGSGGKGTNFVETMLRLGQRGSVRVVSDQVCTPTSTLDLADATCRMLDAGARGLYHWTNSGGCSWHEFALEIFRQAGLRVECTAITSADFGARARRPAYSVLATRKAAALGLGQPRPWQDALAAYLKARTAC